MRLPDPWAKPTLVPADVAEILDLHVDAVRDACRDGRIPVLAARNSVVPSSQSYRIPTTWVYGQVGLPVPARPEAA